MNRKLTALTMSAAIATGIGAAALPATGAFADGANTAVEQASRPSLTQAKKQLAAETGTTRLSVVSGVGYSGDPLYFGAVVTGEDTVEFYVNPGDGWQQTGTKTIPGTGATDDVTVTGADVTGVQYPVFVVNGSFTGNGTGQALLFGHDAHRGWGVMFGKGDLLFPSGHGLSQPDTGLELSIDVVGGTVVTRSLWGPQYDESNAEQTSNPILRTWKGTGGDTLTMQSQRGGPFG